MKIHKSPFGLCQVSKYHINKMLKYNLYIRFGSSFQIQGFWKFQKTSRHQILLNLKVAAVHGTMHDRSISSVQKLHWIVAYHVGLLNKTPTIIAIQNTDDYKCKQHSFTAGFRIHNINNLSFLTSDINQTFHFTIILNK